MRALTFAGIAVPIATTYLLLQPARRAGASLACRVALAIGLGLGISSCAFFLALVLFDGARPAVVGIDAALMAVALGAWWRADPPRAAPRTPLAPRERVLAVAVVAAAAAAALSFIANALHDPHGSWDAWATWNLRARWLANTGAAWWSAFAKPTTHGDYPLLLPGAVARLWVYGGGNDATVPALVAAAYGAALVLLVYAALDALRGRTQALVGALCLLGTPLFLRIAPLQYADAPLAFNLCAVVSLLALYDRDPAGGRLLLLWAGVAAGLTAWTKNEGMMLVLGVVTVRGARRLVRRQWDLRPAAWFAAGLLPPALVVLYFKLVLAPLSAQFGQTRHNIATQLATPSRYALILQTAAAEIVRGIGPVLLALAVYAILLGRTRDQRARSAAIGAASIVGFGAFGYGFNYLIARPELTWLLNHSIDRLLLHLWPSTLLAFLLYAASPAERVTAAAMPAAAARAPGKPRKRPRKHMQGRTAARP